ncbi:protein jagged-1b-like isoform X4 [Elysia marginata]|uniref:Protein jagged-1b-like isoform X4 n=1 Tax=Elysia marginata TaxID=1093978 RepID=A0AAV4ED19_9GAST|nr:protein jagged-1b-like isoform X4 [Elysia marginata]
MVPSADCLDKVDTCRASGAEGCKGIYEPYARKNCPRYCGYCVNPDDLQKECKDKIDNCDEYQDDLCTNSFFSIFAEDNCQKFCNLCDSGPRPVFTGTTTASVNPGKLVDQTNWAYVFFSDGAVVADNSSCADQVDYCWSEPDVNCFGIYEPWSRVNCPFRCGFCTEKPKCEDLLTYCAQYDPSTCTDDYYAGWSRKNCRATCNLCALPTRPPVDPNAPVVTPNPDGSNPKPPSAQTVTPPSASGSSQSTLPPSNPGVDGAQVGGTRTTFIIQGPQTKIPGVSSGNRFQQPLPAVPWSRSQVIAARD